MTVYLFHIMHSIRTRPCEESWQFFSAFFPLDCDTIKGYLLSYATTTMEGLFCANSTCIQSALSLTYYERIIDVKALGKMTPGQSDSISSTEVVRS